MRLNLILTGDINLLGVTDPAVPFARLQDRLRAAFSFVRHNARNETVPRHVAAEQAEVDELRRLSTRVGTTLQVEDDEVVVWRKP
jgi:hypothetical protein